MRKQPLSLLEMFAIMIIVALTVFACCKLSAADTRASDLTAEIGVVKSWNKAIATLESETDNFHELLDSYKRNPPGRVLLAPDVRANQKKRRLQLIDAIISAHEERLRNLRDLRKFEEACL